MIAIFYKFCVDEKFVDQTISQARKVQKHITDNVDACIKYQCSRDLDDKTIMYIFCIWESQEKHEEYLKSEFIQKEVFDKFIEYNAAIVSAEQMTISNLTEGV
nr:antibiotic biosynthesis monooxygenase [uncultured Desulfobacter sp.]